MTNFANLERAIEEFEQWLDSPEYHRWLDSLAERELERRGEAYYPTPCDFGERR